MIRYFIEQAPDRFYERSELPVAKARARRLSEKADSGVYVIAEEFDPAKRDYVQIGSTAFYGGAQDAVEGRMAELANASADASDLGDLPRGHIA
jgi:hypothetical protein